MHIHQHNDRDPTLPLHSEFSHTQSHSHRLVQGQHDQTAKMLEHIKRNINIYINIYAKFYIKCKNNSTLHIFTQIPRDQDIKSSVIKLLQLTFKKMKLLQKASYNKGITEVQQETTECQTRGTDIQRVRPRTHIANCNLIGREEKKPHTHT